MRQASSKINRSDDSHHPLSPAAPATKLPRRVRRKMTAELLAQLAHAAPDERQALQDRIIELNMCVARDVAKRYRRRGISGDDLEQVAHLGLVKAVRSYDPRKATDLLSFAVPTIRGELRRHFRDQGWMVRPPRSIQELQARVRTTEEELYQSLGRQPEPAEVAETLGIDVAHVAQAQSTSGCFAPMSLDDTGADGYGTPVADRLGGEDPGFATTEARVMLLRLMGGLSRRERRILELRFWLGWTQDEIGADIGVTQMQVSRLIKALLEKLRTRLEAGMPGDHLGSGGGRQPA